MKIVILSGGVGGARFVRGVVDVVEPARRDGHRERRRRRRGARHARLARSRLDPLRARRPERRGARLGPLGRDVAARSRPSARSAASRGSGSATATSGCTSCARRRCGRESRSPPSPHASPTALGVATRLLARDRRPPAHLDRDAGRRVPLPGMVRRARAPRRGRRRALRGRRRGAPAPGVLEAIDAAELLLIAPSNPYVSIAPILAVARDPRCARARRVPVRRGQPADRRPRGEGPRRPHARAHRRRHVARARRRCYAGLIDALVVDEADADDLDGLGEVRPIVTRTLMSDADARRRLAEAALGVVPA